MRREALARFCWGESFDLPIQNIFALHLSGVSSLLGAINFYCPSPLILNIFNYENYDLVTVQSDASNCCCFLTTCGSLLFKVNYSSNSKIDMDLDKLRKLPKDKNKND